jgi:hypothetical protein
MKPTPKLSFLADALCFGLFAGLLLGLAAQVAVTVTGPASVALVFVAAVAGWAATDLISGIVHWFCDTFFDERTPAIGPALIGPFREHHHDPLAITRRGFLEVNRSNYVVMIPVLATVLWRGTPAGGATTFAHAFLLFAGIAVALTNQFHKWAHSPRPSRLAAWLQESRLAVGPAHHALHHASDTRAFCVTTGWWDGVLDRVGVFERMKWAVERMRPHCTSRAACSGLFAVIWRRDHAEGIARWHRRISDGGPHGLRLRREPDGRDSRDPPRRRPELRLPPSDCAHGASRAPRPAEGAGRAVP